ncbi:MAG TPA: hypothetical protein VJS20_02775 [Gemmatimonadales bacterium]|nr:hypothetical protein [Gemmatimonadales bacterium]
MKWMKALAIVTAVSVFAMPIQALAVNTAAPATLVQDYAAREAQAADLESFTGGFHGVVITVLALFLIVWLVVEVCSPAEIRIERHHHHGPVYP